MAKGKRFPSDANKPKSSLSGDAAPVADAPQRVVEAKAQETMQIVYNQDNNHALNHYHHLAKGVNTVPVGVWAEAKKHPSVQKLLKDGHIELPGGDQSDCDDEAPALVVEAATETQSDAPAAE